MTFALSGQSWEDPVISWSLAAPATASGVLPAITSALDTAAEQAVLYTALEAWTAVSGLSFVQVADTTGARAPDIRIGFYDRTEGGAAPETLTLGTAYSLRFEDHLVPSALAVVQDPAYRAWVTDPGGTTVYAGTSATPLQVMAHEIGHALGLAHSDTPDDLMYFEAGSANRGFSADDIAGMQFLYGGPLPAEPEVPAGAAAGPGGVAAGIVIQFGADGYLAANRDVATAGFVAMQHFDLYGWREGRDPAAQFDLEYYRAMNPDVAAAGLNPFAHYLAFGRDEGRLAAAAVGHPDAEGFDAEYYLLANPDVARAGVDARLHYTTVGWREGRDPNGYFDTTAYLARNPDVAAAGLDPLAHYVQHGAAEGRSIGPDFDAVAYLAANQDVAATGINPLLHFMLFGLAEGRSAHSVWSA